MSEPTLIQDSSLPYKEKLVAGGYVEFSHLPPSRDDSDWGLLLNVVLLPPELIKLKNALFPKVDGKIKHHLFIIHRSSPCLFSYFEVLSVILCWLILILFFRCVLSVPTSSSSFLSYIFWLFLRTGAGGSFVDKSTQGLRRSQQCLFTTVAFIRILHFFRTGTALLDYLRSHAPPSVLRLRVHSSRRAAIYLQQCRLYGGQDDCSQLLRTCDCHRRPGIGTKADWSRIFWCAGQQQGEGSH